MPCQSYESDWARSSNDSEVHRLKAEADRLARIACSAMTALTDAGQADFLLLKNEEVREWWITHQEADRREQERQAEKRRRIELRAQALSKLSAEERRALGIKTL